MNAVCHGAVGRFFKGLILGFVLWSASASADLSLQVVGAGSFDLGGPEFSEVICNQDNTACFFQNFNEVDDFVTIFPVPDEGWQFSGFSPSCAPGQFNECTFTIPVGSIAPSVTLIFTQITPPTPQWPLTVTVDGGEYGTVLGDGISCPGQCTTIVQEGTVVSLSASPFPDAAFLGWSGEGCSGTGGCSVTVNGPRAVSAAFEGDVDGDGVFAPNDQCPGTPAGTAVDGAGCPLEEPPPPPPEPGGDEDLDGVPDASDACPGTPQGEAVNASGCSESQLDRDGDGVSNAVDECPATPEGAEVDEVGCADSERDGDLDGVSDADDLCPDTPPDTEVDADGCSVEQNFGSDLEELPGLSAPERALAARIDEVCPLLLGADDVADLTPGQRDLLDACVGLKDGGTSEDQATEALRAISLTELAALLDYVVELTASQHEHLGARLRQVAAGGGRGVSVSGLNIRAGDQVIPGQVLQSAFEGLLGMAAGEDSFVDFGKLGLFLQGDINVGDKDETALESGYDFDAWSVTLGGDYRFSDSFFAGASASFGEVEVDYEGQAGQSDIDNWALSLYGGWQLTGNWYLDGLVSYGSSSFDLTRRIIYRDVNGTFDTTQKSSTDGDQVFIGFNTGYMFNRGSWRLGPIASIGYLDGSIDGFDEVTRGPGSKAWNFQVEDRDYKSLRAHLGFQADYIWNTSFGVLIPGVRASWVMETEDEGEEIALRLIHNPFDEELLQSQRIVMETEGRDSSFIDASLNLSGQFKMGFSGFLSYRFYSAYENYSRDGFAIGLRWDKPY